MHRAKGSRKRQRPEAASSQEPAARTGGGAGGGAGAAPAKRRSSKAGDSAEQTSELPSALIEAALKETEYVQTRAPRTKTVKSITCVALVTMTTQSVEGRGSPSQAVAQAKTWQEEVKADQSSCHRRPCCGTQVCTVLPTVPARPPTYLPLWPRLTTLCFAGKGLRSG